MISHSSSLFLTVRDNMKECLLAEDDFGYRTRKIKYEWERENTLKCLSKALLLLSHFSCVRLCDSVRPCRRQPTRLPRPWDSPGKNSGLVCHFLIQCRKVKSESEVTQSCPTLSDPMDCSLPGSSVHGIFQARVLEWGAIAFSALDTLGTL